MGVQYPAEELFRLPTIYRYRVSPSGEQIAFVRDSTGENELYVIDLRTDEITQVSNGDLRAGNPGPIMWAPDGSRLYFQRAPERDVSHTIATIQLDGRVETLLDLDDRVHLEDVSPDGRYLLFMYHGDFEGPYHRHLYRFDREMGAIEQLTDYDHPVQSRVLFSPTGDKIAYQVYRLTEGQENSNAYVAQADGDQPRQLTIGEEGSDSCIIDWHPEGEQLLVTDDATGLHQAGVYDLETDDVTWFGDNEFEVRPMAFLPTGGGFLARHYQDVTTVPAVYTLDGTVRELSLDDGVADFPKWVKPYPEIFLADGDVLLLYSTESRLAELVRYDLGTDTMEIIIDADYGGIDPTAFVNAEYVTYDSEDGLEIGALLYRPDTSPAPAIVHIHGGPESRFERSFDPYGQYAQYFVNRGYAVLQPNYRGSTGRGSDFRRLIHDDWGHGDAADIVAGARWLQARDWIDEDRIVVFGQSYGAYGVFVQMTKYPTLWTAGIAWNGQTDGFRSDKSYNPLANVENVERPLLILAGENDPSIESMRRFRDALRDRGWIVGTDFEHEELATEGHHSRDSAQQIRRFEIIKDFLDRRV